MAVSAPFTFTHESPESATDSAMHGTHADGDEHALAEPHPTLQGDGLHMPLSYLSYL